MKSIQLFINTQYVFDIQHNDDPELWAELKRKEVEYERRRNKRVQYFESVRTAQTVQIEDIPLPDITDKPQTPSVQPQASFGNMPPPLNLPLQVPPSGIQIPPSIQSAIAAHQKAQSEEKSTIDSKPPGCPPGLPPDLLLMRDLDSDYESEDSDRGRRSPISKRSRTRRYSSDRSSDRSEDARSESEPELDVPKPTSVQQRMLAIAGQKYDDFMKELENVHSQSDDRQPSKHTDKKRNDDNSRSGDDSNRDSDETKPKSTEPNAKTQNVKLDNEANAPQAMRKENPVAIPNMSAIPAPPMPPPMMHKMPRPPPPPMGNVFTFVSNDFHARV